MSVLEPIGHVMMKREFTATKMWPDPQMTMKGVINVEKQYKEALAGQIVTVMEESVDKTAYLVLGGNKKSDTCGAFMWMIEKEDTVKGSFIPVVWKYGTLMPAGMGPLEEFEWMAKNMASETDAYMMQNPGKPQTDIIREILNRAKQG